MAETWRSFVAIDLPDVGRERAVREIEALQQGRSDVRWVRESQLHLTLRFLGDVEVERIDGVRDALRGIAPRHAPIRLTLSGLGRFPPRGRPNVFWMGLGGELDLLDDLAGDVERALARLGFPPERRPFRPHVTIGRVRGPRGLRELEAAVRVRDDEFTLELPAIDAFRLYRSELDPDGARHSIVEEFALGGSPGRD